MPVGSEGLIAGPYTVTWNSTSVGIFLGDENVPSIIVRNLEEPIANSDKYGKTKIDGIHMGQMWIFQGVLMEYSKGTPVVDPFGTFGSALGVIGVLRWTLAKALVLTAVSGTSAAATPATLTSNKTIQSADFDAKVTFGPQLRVVPIRLDMLPYDVGAGAVGFNVKT